MDNEKVARLIRQGIAALSEALYEVEPGGADVRNIKASLKGFKVSRVVSSVSHGRICSRTSGVTR